MKSLIVIVTLALLGGCASTSFEDQVGKGYGVVEGVAKKAQEYCGNTVSVSRGGFCQPDARLTTPEARALREQLVEAKALLDTAAVMWFNKDKREAESILDQAVRILAVVSARIKAHGAARQPEEL